MVLSRRRFIKTVNYNITIMKKILIGCLISSVVLISCGDRKKNRMSDDINEKNEQMLKDTTTVEAIDTVYNFGLIADGDKVEYNFRFKNTGKKPLIIKSATASCGCTVPEKPERPIMPNETGFLKVVFNSKGKAGHVEKSITVTSNAYPDFPILLMRGEIKTNQEQ